MFDARQMLIIRELGLELEFSQIETLSLCVRNLEANLQTDLQNNLQQIVPKNPQNKSETYSSQFCPTNTLRLLVPPLKGRLLQARSDSSIEQIVPNISEISRKTLTQNSTQIPTETLEILQTNLNSELNLNLNTELENKYWEIKQKKQEIKILKTKLTQKIRKNWQIYEQKSSIQKFCPYVQIKLCDGICGHRENLQDYKVKIEQIKAILGGKIKKAKSFLQTKIMENIENQNYALAALWRDRIKNLDELTIDQNVVLSAEEDLDLLTLVLQNTENGLVLGSVFCQNIREGKVVNVSNYLLSGNSSGENESEIAFSFWQRFLSSFVVSKIDFAPVIIQTFWNETVD